MVNDAQESNVEGVKKDAGKPRLDLLPPEGLVAVGKVMTYGADKYGDHNYRMGMRHGRLIAAALRHITAYNSGENLDAETGLSHVSHAGACILMLLQMMRDYPSLDDRYKPVTPCKEMCGDVYESSEGVYGCGHPWPV